ncbi:hypothetical protein Taro_054863 [Colocasia esculenta]|uniref:Uncharacterized protein n=1 Tax=Colocasia esculenta TaxID=4460 RepID=A0A843XQ03_COLES|nr:hypothetical protein [Colocasia esculenta]
MGRTHRMRERERERGGEGVLPQMLVWRDEPLPELMEEGEEEDAPASRVEWKETMALDSEEEEWIGEEWLGVEARIRQGFAASWNPPSTNDPRGSIYRGKNLNRVGYSRRDKNLNHVWVACRDLNRVGLGRCDKDSNASGRQAAFQKVNLM